MAGLSLFGQAGLAEEEIPARKSAPAPTALPAITPTPFPTNTPIPSVRPEELKAAEARLNASLSSGLQKIADNNDALDKQLDSLRDKVRELGLSGVDLKQRLDKQGEDARAMAESQQAFQKKLDDSMKKTEDVRAAIESKGGRMEGLLDLVNTLKRDLNDNSHEIAELKRDLEAYKKISQAPIEEQPWWGQIAQWRYLPLAATVLGGVALGVAASRK